MSLTVRERRQPPSFLWASRVRGVLLGIDDRLPSGPSSAGVQAGGVPEMASRLELLGFLQDTAAKLRQVASEQATPTSPELFGIADEIELEAMRLEIDLVDEGLLSVGVAPPKAANQN